MPFRSFALSSAEPNLVAAARLELLASGDTDPTVEVWEINPPHLRSSIQTVLDSGGDRLALCGDALTPLVVTGAWARHGICGYDEKSGRRLWQRKDLKRVQMLAPAIEGSSRCRRV